MKKISMVLTLSEKAADVFYWAGGILILLSALGGLLGTLAALWGDRERERYADIRTSENENKTAEANKQAALANERAVKSELELEQIKERQRPRTLTTEQRQLLVTMLSAFAGQKIRVTENLSTNEAPAFSKQIVSALKDAGWFIEPDEGRSGLFGVPGKPVIQVFVLLNQPPPPVGAALANALQSCGFKVTYSFDSDVAGTGVTPWPLEKGTIGLIVGPKE